MDKLINVLEHGYVEIIEGWGSDERIVEAARMSTNKGFLGWGPKRVCNVCGCPCEMSVTPECSPGVLCRPVEKPGDEKLLRYLYEHKHATPFEMAGLVLEIQAPIFVFREWHRHRTQSYNELSARYTPLPDLNYIPTVERIMINSKTNKQAGLIVGADEMTVPMAEQYRTELAQMYRMQEEFYQKALKSGVPKELARIHLPVGRFSRMRASANLRNWLAFLTLRMDTAAQWEIRQYAYAVAAFVKYKFPRTWELFADSNPDKV